jgi:hypothetical protein
MYLSKTTKNNFSMEIKSIKKYLNIQIAHCNTTVCNSMNMTCFVVPFKKKRNQALKFTPKRALSIVLDAMRQEIRLNLLKKKEGITKHEAIFKGQGDVGVHCKARS